MHQCDADLLEQLKKTITPTVRISCAQMVMQRRIISSKCVDDMTNVYVMYIMSVFQQNVEKVGIIGLRSDKPYFVRSMKDMIPEWIMTPVLVDEMVDVLSDAV